jgi:hypothetical protein
MHPVAWELAWLIRAFPNPGDKPLHPVMAQQCFEIVNLVAVYGAFR